MSGIRQSRGITCPCCGREGVVHLGMAMLQGRDDSRDFECACCGHALHVEAPRAIVDLTWNDAATAENTVLPS